MTTIPNTNTQAVPLVRVSPGKTPARQISVMHGTYCPPPSAATRTGAMDYAQLPSLHMGRRYAWTGAKA